MPSAVFRERTQGARTMRRLRRIFSLAFTVALVIIAVLAINEYLSVFGVKSPATLDDSAHLA